MTCVWKKASSTGQSLVLWHTVAIQFCTSPYLWLITSQLFCRSSYVNLPPVLLSPSQRAQTRLQSNDLGELLLRHSDARLWVMEMNVDSDKMMISNVTDLPFERGLQALDLTLPFAKAKPISKGTSSPYSINLCSNQQINGKLWSKMAKNDHTIRSIDEFGISW